MCGRKGVLDLLSKLERRSVECRERTISGQIMELKQICREAKGTGREYQVSGDSLEGIADGLSVE